MVSETVEFNSEGYRLIGNLNCPGDNTPCVIFCHGIVSSKDSEKWLAFASALEGAGFASLRFNFRGCGWGDEWSEGIFEDTTLTSRITDFKAALDFLKNATKVDANRTGVIGSSFGGCTIIAANDSRPKAYVAMATPYQWVASPEMQRGFADKGYYQNPGVTEPRMSRIKEDLFSDLASYNMGDAVKKIRQPLLIIHGSRDTIPVSDARKLYEQANEPKRLEIIEGGSHTFVDTGHLDKIIELSVDWLKRHL